MDFLKDIIKEVEDTFLAEIYENKMILENRIPEDLTIKTDRNLLITVFNNLISNAIKYGEPGGHIVINAELKENLVKFSVYNDGVVVKEDEKGNLFKKFSRLETEKNKKIKGTGLGLFIIKNIIDNLGGNIWLEAREKGNEFVFEIERD